MKGVTMKKLCRKTPAVDDNIGQTRKPPAMTPRQWVAIWFSVWIVAIGVYWLWSGNINWRCAGAITGLVWLLPAGGLVLICLQRDG